MRKGEREREREGRLALIEKAIGKSISGFMASSGKLRKACMSFSNGNFTCE